jgi:hypothetical protein
MPRRNLQTKLRKRAGTRTWVLEHAQQLDLAQDARGVCHIVKHILDLLDSHALMREVVDGCARRGTTAGGGCVLEKFYAMRTCAGGKPACLHGPHLRKPRRMSPCR